MHSKRSINTALISLSDKTQLVDFAKKLYQLGIRILSTGGTAQILSEMGIPFTKVADLTHFPEIMDGRVKTLHPQIHGGILGKRDLHAKEAEEQGIDWIDLVVVNLYPFEAVIEGGADFDEAIENIDIGGPAMLRAAAKNHEWVTVVHDFNDYAKVLEAIEQGGVTYETRRHLAAKAFAHTAYYDAVITQYLRQKTSLLEYPQLTIPLKRLETLRYGENPHQAAGLFQTGFGEGLAKARVLQGKALSYNNLVDAEAAFQCVKEFQKPAAVVLKHANPCGVAVSIDIDSAYQKAFSADSQSAFGGIIALNRPCTLEIAKHVTSIFMEVILAPGFSEDALVQFKQKQNLRVIEIPHWEQAYRPYMFRAISGGLLIQTSDQVQLTEKDLQCQTQKKPTPSEMDELLFAWILVKHLKSNAIAITQGKVSQGLSGGQVSRIAALECALQRAQGNLDGAVLASDAFFPFRDSIDALKDTGIHAIIQPGGSIRDAEIITACDDYGIAMVFTNIRCFNH